MAEPLPHDHAPLDELDGQLVALAQDGPRGLGDLGEPGQRPVADDREALGQPDRLDDVGRRDRDPLVPQHPGRVGQPALDRAVGVANRWAYQPGEVTPAP